MGFWKNLFTGSEPTSQSQNLDYERYTTIEEQDASSQAVHSPNRSNGRIFFSLALTYNQ